MSVNVKQNGDLTKVANNISIVQANWNDINNTDKNTCIKNQPETLNTMEEITANTNENALAGANAVKELSDSLVKYKSAQYTISCTTAVPDGNFVKYSNVMDLSSKSDFPENHIATIPLMAYHGTTSQNVAILGVGLDGKGVIVSGSASGTYTFRVGYLYR